jgi:SAM-dependent methyltransferase
VSGAVYTDRFYADQRTGARSSARVVVPLVLSLVQARRVIDVGCGVGAWLATFREHGVEDVWGVDGDYVDRALLEIPRERFVAADLRQPFRMDPPFDLALSLEVAEHLPPESADTFVRTLTGLATVVLFSAAIPFQGGMEHLNEQWPAYWAERFAAGGYVAVDCLREQIWDDERVQWWYAQNVLLFARGDALTRHPALARARGQTAAMRPRALIHPGKYLAVIDWCQRSEAVATDLDRIVPAGQRFVFVDDEALRGCLPSRARAIPFLERDGQYWGLPADDGVAMAELARQRRAGAACIAFAWPAFWWFEHYGAFHRHLRSTFECMLENERLVVFDLRRAKRRRP